MGRKQRKRKRKKKKSEALVAGGNLCSSLCRRPWQETAAAGKVLSRQGAAEEAAADFKAVKERDA